MAKMTKAQLEARVAELEAALAEAESHGAPGEVTPGVTVTPGIPVAGNTNGRNAEHNGQEYPTRLVTIQVAVADVPAIGYEATQIRTRGNLQAALDGPQFRALRASTFGLALPELRSGRKLGTHAEATRQIFQAIHDAAWPNGYPDAEPEVDNQVREHEGDLIGRPEEVDGVRIVPDGEPASGFYLHDLNTQLWCGAPCVWVTETIEINQDLDLFESVEAAHAARREHLAERSA